MILPNRNLAYTTEKVSRLHFWKTGKGLQKSLKARICRILQIQWRSNTQNVPDRTRQRNIVVRKQLSSQLRRQLIFYSQNFQILTPSTCPQLTRNSSSWNVQIAIPSSHQSGGVSLVLVLVTVRRCCGTRCSLIVNSKE